MPDGDRHPFEVVAESFLIRYRAGERPSVEDYAALHPDLADDIRRLLPALVRIEQDLTIDSRPVPASRRPVEIGGESRPSQLGDYQILREIGRGGMGVVYEAEQVSLGRRVALKVLPRHVVSSRNALHRFQREARAAARLHHTNIVPVFEVGQDCEAAFYAMQLIQGQGLDQIIDELRRLGDTGPKSVGGGQTESGVPVNAEATLGGPDGFEAGREHTAIGYLAKSMLHGRLATEVPEPPANTSPRTISDARPVDSFHLAAVTEPISPAGESSLPEASSTADLSNTAVLPGGTAVSAIGSSVHSQPFFRSVAQIGRQAAQGLAYAHARGVIHRDIKPSNLLLDSDGVLWITDFGLAKSEEDDLTATGDILGTLRYMAPERFRGEGDGRADIYALGLTLYELLTFRPAFDTSNRLKLIERIKSEEPPRPRSLDPRIPRDLETIVLKASSKAPASRYATAEAMAEDLRRFLADEPIKARQISTSERYWRWARRNPVIAVLGGC